MMSPVQVAYTLEQCWHPVPGGSAVAALKVARELDAIDDVDIVGVAGRHRRPPAASFRPNVEMRWLPVGRPWLYETWNRFGWPKVEAVTGMLDVCHSTVAIPAATEMASVVTVHDVAFVHTPARFTNHGVKVMTAGLERCRRVDIICCPSEATRRDLIDLNFDADRIRVVPWGVDPQIVSDAQVDATRKRYGLPDAFVLFVGTREPRKNLERLAMATSGSDLPLVVAGEHGWGDDPVVGDDVQFLGFVATDDLAAVYAAATVFAYPSLQEGFGMPVLEAMAQGTPVVTSAGTATEEAAGGAAVLVDPTSVDSIGDGLLEATRRSADLAERGRARVVDATWQRSAELTREAYRDAMASRGSA